MRLALIVAALVCAAPLAGCIGETEPTQPASIDEAPGLNPWQAGLADHHPTPEVATHRSADERRANLAEPGAPEFAAFDAKVQGWMEVHDIPTGQLALMKDGQLRYVRAYGYTDRAETEPANASTMFRVASVTKPITAALVALQVEQGLYNWTDPVFCVPPDPAPNCRLPIEPHPRFPVVDDRISNVTVRHLIDHTGGWGRTADPITFGEGTIEVAREMGIQTPPSTWRLAQYLMGQEMPHVPGEVEEYCNVCYMFAGLVAEAATGTELGALWDAYLFEPLEVEGDIEPGYTQPDERNPREPFYHCDEEATSVFDPNETVCEPNGEVSLQTIMGAGGLVSTAEAIAATYEAYSSHAPQWLRLQIEDETFDCSPTMDCRWHTGGFPGSATASGIVEGDGWKGQFVLLFNKNVPWEGCRSTVGAAVDEVVPLYDCSVYDLVNSMFYLTGAWAQGEHALPAGAPGG